MIRISAYLLGAAPLAFAASAAVAQTPPPVDQQAAVEAADNAQQSPNATPQPADESVGADIVVVGTAGAGTRRQDASFAVTSINADAIARAAPASTADLLRTVPGVSAESSGGKNGANIFVRGYPSGGDAQFVTFQVAGVPIFPPPTLSFLENSQLVRLDATVERVEAVRGGTGSLFSAGQPGLTVNVVPRTGGSVFEGFAKISYADFGDVRGDAWVSGPLGGNTGFMIGGYYNSGHGLRDPRFTVERGGQITANINHDFDDGRGSVLVYARYLNDHGQWLLPIPVVQNGSDISEYPGFDYGAGTLAGPETRVTVNQGGRRVDLADGRGAKIVNAGIAFEYAVADGLRFRERTAYLGGSADTSGLVPTEAPVAASAMAVTLGGTGATVGSLTYANGGGALTTGAATPVMRAGIWNVKKDVTSFVSDTALEWSAGSNKLTGGFYYANFTTRDDWSLGNQVLLTGTPNARLLNLTLGDGRVATTRGFTSGPGYQVLGSYTGNDYAFYAVDELQITPELRVDGGVRWQRHTIDGQVRTPAGTAAAAAAAIAARGGLPGATVNANGTVNLDGNVATLYDNGVNILGVTPQLIDYSASAWSWTAGANYDFSRNVGVFLRYSRGRSFPQFDNMRGTSATDIANRTGPAITASVDTYEGGLKITSQYANLYATVFHNEFTGLSSTAIINNAVVTSVGGAKATGVELEGVLRPVSWFSLTGAGTYLDGTYDNYFTNGGLNDVTGNRVQRQPRWSWRVTPALDIPVGGLRPSLYATLQYTGDRFSDPDNRQLLPKFYQLDAGISVTVAERFTLAVTGNNLTNEFGLTEGNPRIIGSQGTGPILARPILGRSFNFSAAVKF